MYHVSRNGQIYGPYTIDDLHRYLASGHILPSDSIKSDEMTDWRPVHEILGTAVPGATIPGTNSAGSATSSGSAGAAFGQQQPPLAPAGFGVPPGFAPGAAFAPPPDLHWVLVLLFDFLTCSLFQLLWNLILAAWFRRVYPPTRVLLLYAVAAVLIFAQGAFGQTLGFVASRHTHLAVGNNKGVIGYGFVAVICWIVRLVARFTLRAELEQHYNTVEPIGLEVNPVLTFFFGGIYLQSVMNRINAIKRGVAFGGYPR